MNCGDIEENPGVLDQCYINNNLVTNAVLGVRNSNILLETRLREFNRIAVDVGGGGDCFLLRALSHQLYGNRYPNNHYLVRSLGIEEKTYMSLGIIPKSLHVCDLEQSKLCRIFRKCLHDFPQLKSLSTLSERLSYYTFKVMAWLA